DRLAPPPVRRPDAPGPPGDPRPGPVPARVPRRGAGARAPRALARLAPLPGRLPPEPPALAPRPRPRSHAEPDPAFRPGRGRGRRAGARRPPPPRPLPPHAGLRRPVRRRDARAALQPVGPREGRLDVPGLGAAAEARGRPFLRDVHGREPAVPRGARARGGRPPRLPRPRRPALRASARVRLPPGWIGSRRPGAAAGGGPAPAQEGLRRPAGG